MTKPTRLYCITARSTGRFYVGITTNSVALRWKKHISDANCRPHYPFPRAIAKYGPDDFEVLELFVYPSRDEALEAESYLIAILNLTREGYNAAIGGRGGVHTEESRAKISKSMSGRTLSPEHRERIAVANRRRRVPPKPKPPRKWKRGTSQNYFKNLYLRKEALFDFGGVDTDAQKHDTLMIGTV
jgi:group I intron endonuclease